MAATQPAGTRPDEESLPVGLWIGTAVFALLAAGLLALSMRMGRQALVGSADKEIEKHALEPRSGSLDEAAAQPQAAPQAAAKPAGFKRR